MEYKILEWDSAFFGIRTALIVKEDLAAETLSRLLRELSEDRVDLVYWAASLSIHSKIAALTNGGKYVDRKTKYIMNADAVKKHEAVHRIEEYTGELCEELKSLAIQCGYHSRFAVDPVMPENAMERLYEEWIAQSVSKHLAEAVLVAKINEKIVGMVTVGNKNGSGDIGLLAVDKSFRGQSIGEHLVYAAQLWFIDRGFKTLQVVTQGNNTEACRLYEKCGYRIGLVQEYYHFWLKR